MIIVQDQLPEKYKAYYPQYDRLAVTRLPKQSISPTASIVVVPEEHPSAMWLQDIYSWVGQNKNRKAMAILFNHIDDLLSASEFKLCDGILKTIDLNRLNTTLMVAVLSITLTGRNKLPERARLARRIRGKLEVTEPERVERLLRGLEA